MLGPKSSVAPASGLTQWTDPYRLRTHKRRSCPGKIPVNGAWVLSSPRPALCFTCHLMPVFARLHVKSSQNLCPSALPCDINLSDHGVLAGRVHCPRLS